MAENHEFLQLVERLRQGDEAAAREIVSIYEPLIRGKVRSRLTDARFRRLFDSSDITQSTLASFFIRANAGQFALEGPAQLGKLLSVMVRNKLAERIRRETAQRRDVRRLSSEATDMMPLADEHLTEDDSLEISELIQQARGQMSPEVKEIVRLRELGLDWEQVAGQLGGTPDARRKQLSRAVSQIVLALGLES